MARLYSRGGISLLEVLISMFVLLFGLMGVAAIFPVGNHYAGRGEQYDRAAALTDQAFAEIKARGLLRPDVWLYAEASQPNERATENGVYRMILPSGANAGSFNMTLGGSGPNSGGSGPGHAFVLDPMGVAAAKQLTTQYRGVQFFPFTGMGTNPDVPGGVATTPKGDPIATNTDMPQGWRAGNYALDGTRWPIRRITVPSNDPLLPTMTPGVAETICRLRDDLANEEPNQDDRPGHLRWQSQVVGAMDDPKRFDPGDSSTFTYGDDLPLSRQYGGSYSWIATIVPTSYLRGPTPDALQALQPSDPHHGSFMYDVSVAVFYKRTNPAPSAQTERAIEASMNLGGELVLHANNNTAGVEAVDAAVADLRPGHWIAVAGVHPTNGNFLLRWYKVLSIDGETVWGNNVDPITPGKPISADNPRRAHRRVMLEGVDWPLDMDTTVVPAQPKPAHNLRALIMPGVIGVSTQTLALAEL